MSALDPAASDALLALARAAATARAHGAPVPDAAEAERLPALTAPRGAFVTLEVGGELRGCIGSFRPEGSLAQTVARMASAAASEDPRFPPLRPDELAALAVHVSVLAPLRPMSALEELVVGRDGVLVSKGWHRGALLPRVAVEHGWDGRELLRRACLKAGLPPDAWRDPTATVQLFSAEELESPPPAPGGRPAPA